MKVVLVHPEIPGNTGNIGRTCLATGAELHVVEPLGFSLDAAQVRRAGLDYWKHVALTVHPGIDALEAALPDLDQAFFLSARAERSLYDVDLPANPTFVFGRETKGLPEVLRTRYADRLVSLPIDTTHVRSLNLANTVAAVLFEAQRRAR
jgi:tRNA (cytidine/uridine-2'-O-)-methyltransferase